MANKKKNVLTVGDTVIWNGGFGSDAKIDAKIVGIEHTKVVSMVTLLILYLGHKCMIGMYVLTLTMVIGHTQIKSNKRMYNFN